MAVSREIKAHWLHRTRTLSVARPNDNMNGTCMTDQIFGIAPGGGEAPRGGIRQLAAFLV